MPIIRQRDSTPLTAWKNGGGVTQELLAWPSTEDWCVRLSIATIDKDGAFSALPGVSRWFTVIEGLGINLTLDGQKKTVKQGDDPLRFDGHQQCDAVLLEGKVTAFNVMMRDSWAGRVQRIQASQSVPVSTVPLSPQRHVGLFALEHCHIELGQAELKLEKHSLLWQPILAPCGLTVHAGALIAVHACPSHVHT